MTSSRRVRLVYGALLVLSLTLVSAGWLAFARSGDTLAARRHVEGVVGRPARINPLFAAPDSVDADLAALVFSGLTRLAGDGTPLPDLAERWEVTPDGLTYTFHLRPSLFWHDGTALTAHDVAFTLAQLQAEGFRGPPALASGWRGVEVLVPGDLTVIVRLPAPSASFLARAGVGVLPRHLLEGLGPDELFEAAFNLRPVGSGPYRLEGLGTEVAELRAHASYHLGVPAIERIDLRFYPDEPALASAVARAEVDAVLVPATAAGPVRAALVERPALVGLELPEAGFEVLYLNNQRAPLNELAVRRAIAAAIDTAALQAEVFSGRGQPGRGPFVPGTWAHLERAAASPRASLEEARALLEEAGWTGVEGGARVREGARLSLELATNAEARRVALAEAVATQLRAAGIEATVVPMPSSQLISQRLQPRDYQLAIFGWDAGVDPDPYGAWHTSQIVAGSNVAGFNDAEADALLEGARVTLDVRERAQLYARFEERFRLLAPAVVLHYPARTYAVPRELEGVSGGLLFEASSRFRDVHRWAFAE